MNKYISDEIIAVVKRIAIEYPKIVFCGSLGLVLNDKLHREIKDIDLLADKDYYTLGNFYNEIRVGNISDSHKFMVGKDEVLSFKLKFPIGNEYEIREVKKNDTDNEFDIFEQLKSSSDKEIIYYNNKFVMVDVLYNKDSKPNSKSIDFDGVKILVEEPDSAIKAKMGYIIHDKSTKSALKHLKDLIYLGVDRSKLISLIDISQLSKDDDDDDIPFF